MSEAFDWKNLAAMMAGGMAYRWGKTAVLSSQFSVLSRGMIVPSIVRGGSIVFGLASEVTVFEFTNRTLLTLSPHPAPLPGGEDGRNASRFWSWSGPGGWKEGLLSSLVTFSFLKGAGHLARQENWALQQFFPAAAMVAGHQAAGILGISPKPEGTLAEQLTHALATNLQMGAGMSLLHSLSNGKILGWEKSMESTTFGSQLGFSGLGTEWAAVGVSTIKPESLKVVQGPLLMSSTDDSSSDSSKAPHRSESEQKALAKALLDESRLEHQDPDERAGALSTLRGTLPRLHEEDRGGRLAKIGDRMNDPDLSVRSEALFTLSEYLQEFILIKGRSWVRTQVEDGFRNTETNALGYAHEALDLLLPFLDPSERRQSLRKIFELWEKGFHGPEGEKELLEAIYKTAQSLRFSERMEHLHELVKGYGLKNLPWVLVNLLLPPSSLEAFLHFSKKSGDADLLRLASYQAAHMPPDPYLWNLYLNARDPLLFLRTLPFLVSPYRHGKVLDQFDGKELHLAFAGLDSPPALSFEIFEKQFKKKAPPAPFLNRPFSASVSELRTFHELIDKGKLAQGLQPLEKVKTPRAFQEYLRQKLDRERGSLKGFKNEIESIVRLDSSFGMEEFSNQIHFLIPHLWEKRDSPVVQEIILNAAFFLAWHEKGEASLKEKMIRSLGKQIPSETLWEGLVATEEFYRITLEEVLSSFGLDTEKMPALKKHRRLLKAEMERIKGEKTSEAVVEFIPSKTQTDRYFGYVAEDCNKTRGNLLDRKDFQVYRMIARGRLAGMIYLQRAKLDDKNMLVLALQPRPFWNIDHDALLKAVEDHLGRIAAEEGYEVVLLMQEKNQQSNRQDMLKAIEKRKYEKLHLRNNISGVLFSGRDFLVMWKNEPGPKAPSRLLDLIKERWPIRKR